MLASVASSPGPWACVLGGWETGTTAQIQKHICSTYMQRTRYRIYEKMAICVNEDCKCRIDIGEALDDKPSAFRPDFLTRRVVSRSHYTGLFPVRRNEGVFRDVDNFGPAPIRLSSLDHSWRTELRKARTTVIEMKCVVTRGNVCYYCHWEDGTCVLVKSSASKSSRVGRYCNIGHAKYICNVYSCMRKCSAIRNSHPPRIGSISPFLPPHARFGLL